MSKVRVDKRTFKWVLLERRTSLGSEGLWIHSIVNDLFYLKNREIISSNDLVKKMERSVSVFLSFSPFLFFYSDFLSEQMCTKIIRSLALFSILHITVKSSSVALCLLYHQRHYILNPIMDFSEIPINIQKISKSNKTINIFYFKFYLK